MTIQLKSIVAIHYTLKDDRGVVLDASADDQPLVYLHGAGTIIPGLEKELFGKQAGDSFEATISPDQAYGDHHAEMVQTVPLDAFKEEQTLEIGMSFSGNTPEGPINVVITDIQDGMATLDANHPMAGKTLHFAVDIDSVREATEEELMHGHAHKPGGCDHKH